MYRVQVLDTFKGVKTYNNLGVFFNLSDRFPKQIRVLVKQPEFVFK